MTTLKSMETIESFNVSLFHELVRKLVKHSMVNIATLPTGQSHRLILVINQVLSVMKTLVAIEFMSRARNFQTDNFPQEVEELISLIYALPVQGALTTEQSDEILRMIVEMSPSLDLNERTESLIDARTTDMSLVHVFGDKTVVDYPDETESGGSPLAHLLLLSVNIDDHKISTDTIRNVNTVINSAVTLHQNYQDEDPQSHYHAFLNILARMVERDDLSMGEALTLETCFVFEGKDGLKDILYETHPQQRVRYLLEAFQELGSRASVDLCRLTSHFILERPHDSIDLNEFKNVIEHRNYREIPLVLIATMVSSSQNAGSSTQERFSVSQNKRLEQMRAVIQR